MSFCPNCGKEIVSKEEGCTNCGYKPVIEGQVIYEEVKEQSNQEKEQFQKKASSYEKESGQAAPSSENSGLSTLLKVLIIVMIVLMPGVGSIVGIVAGIIFMSKEDEESRKFGKIMLFLSIGMIALGILCCCIGLLFNIFLAVASSGSYYY